MDTASRETMRALVVTAHGGREVLQVDERPVPSPGAGEVVIAVEAAGVNFVEVYQRQGVYPTRPPFVLGGECAGRVVAVGTDVDGVAVGDLVATTEATGAMAERAVARADRVVPVPDGVSAEQAAALLLQGMTAHYLVTSTFPLQGGQWALVHAAAGGVGQLLVQLARGRGASVVATAGSAGKADIARSLGADAVIRYDELAGDALADAVRSASDGGVHVVYDGVGQATFDASLASLRRRGMLVLFGAASGPVGPVDPQRLNRGGSLFLTRPTLADYTVTTDELRWRAGELLAALADGSLRLEIGGRYPMADAAQAYADLEERRSTGKLLILP